MKEQGNNCKSEETIATVLAVSGNEVTVEIEKKGACKSCSINMLCMGSSNKTVFSVKSDQVLYPGDIVKLHISPGSRLLSSFIVFIFPIILIVTFYFVARLILSLSEDYAILSSLTGLLLSGIIIKIIDTKLANKINVKITERL